MGPNPALGTNVGQAYISQEGFGRAAIFGPSKAADTYVTMRREKLAYERQTQAAAAKQAAETRQKAMEKLMTQPKYYEKFSDEVLTMEDGVHKKGYTLMERGILDPFAASKDPEVIAFQDDWRNYQLAAQTSISIKERDGKMIELLSGKDAAQEYDLETYLQENDKFFDENTLLDITKKVDKMPTPQSRYGFIKASADFQSALKTAFGTRVPTDEEITTFTAAFMADNDRAAKEFVGFYSTPVPAREAPQGARAFAAAIGQQMGSPLVGDFTKPELYNEAAMNTKNMPIEAGVKFAKSVLGPFDFMGVLSDSAKELNASIGTTDWGTKEKEIRPKARAEAIRMIRQYPHILNLTDPDDGGPYAIGANQKEKYENTLNRLTNELIDKAKVDSKDPGYRIRLANSLKTSEPKAKMEDWIANLKADDKKAQGLVSGRELPDGSKIESVDFTTFGETITAGGSFRVITVSKDDDDKPVRSTRFMTEDEFKKTLFQPWMATTQKKQVEATDTPDTYEESVSEAPLD